MKPKAKRKALQEKINNYLGAFVKTMTDNDSKRLKKSLKKASRLVAKAIIRNSDESEVVHSLQDKPALKKAVVVKKKPVVKKTTKPVAVKRTQPKKVQKQAKPVKPISATTVKKTDGIQSAPFVTGTVTNAVIR